MLNRRDAENAKGGQSEGLNAKVAKTAKVRAKESVIGKISKSDSVPNVRDLRGSYYMDGALSILKE
jgi:hypothetical protein